jgi:hypothetical protein
VAGRLVLEAGSGWSGDWLRWVEAPGEGVAGLLPAVQARPGHPLRPPFVFRVDEVSPCDDIAKGARLRWTCGPCRSEHRSGDLLPFGRGFPWRAAQLLRISPLADRQDPSVLGLVRSFCGQRYRAEVALQLCIYRRRILPAFPDEVTAIRMR